MRRTLADFKDRETLKVEEAAEVLGISRGSAWAAVNNGDIKAIRIGRRVLVLKWRLAQLLNG